MRTLGVLAAAIVTAAALCEPAAAQQPVYQRRPAARPDFRPPARQPVATQPGGVRPPGQRPPGEPLPGRRVPLRQAPTVEAGSFQRPYPYHLDYYKQRFGGGYEPYFGNLYGSPSIVGTQPFAFSPYPQPAPTQPVQPLTAPALVCPHCGQAVQLPWQAPQ